MASSTHLKLLHQEIEEVLQLDIAGLNLKLGDPAVADEAVLLPGLLVGEGVDAVGVLEVDIVLERLSARRHDLDDLEGAGGGDDGVGGGHGRDDVLDDALRKAVCDARDAVGGRPLLK